MIREQTLEGKSVDTTARPTRVTATGQSASSIRLRRERGEALHVFLCVAIPLLCVFAAHPFSATAFNDDWSYSHVALKLAETGRIRYNGWGPAMQLVQAIWGAGWIRLFGFSFDVLRLATLPFSIGFVWLTYALGRKAGLRGELACFGALVIGTSPLFVPLAASFMTEPYACFFTVLCLYAAVSSAEARASKSAVFWLWALALAGLLGGSDRQSVWTAPLTLIPYLFWVRHSDRRFVLHATAAYVVLIAAIAALASHFTQSYPGLDVPRQELTAIVLRNFFSGSGRLLGLLLASLQVTLPALLCFRSALEKDEVVQRLGPGLCVNLFDRSLDFGRRRRRPVCQFCAIQLRTSPRRSRWTRLSTSAFESCDANCRAAY